MKHEKLFWVYFGSILLIALAFIGLMGWGLIKLIQWIP